MFGSEGSFDSLLVVWTHSYPPPYLWACSLSALLRVYLLSGFSLTVILWSCLLFSLKDSFYLSSNISWGSRCTYIGILKISLFDTIWNSLTMVSSFVVSRVLNSTMTCLVIPGAIGPPITWYTLNLLSLGYLMTIL